jgi:hypothetical protein
VEGTSVTLLSSRSGRTRGDEQEEEQQVKMPGTITDVGHRNVHLWSVGRRRREEEEDDDERREKAELMALLRPVVSISGHHATPPPVDESYQPTRTTAGSSRDPPTPTAAAAAGPSTLVNNTTTADDFQWTIEWTPSADVFRHHSATSPSSSRSSASVNQFETYFTKLTYKTIQKVREKQLIFRGRTASWPSRHLGQGCARNCWCWFF